MIFEFSFCPNIELEIDLESCGGDWYWYGIHENLLRIGPLPLAMRVLDNNRFRLGDPGQYRLMFTGEGLQHINLISKLGEDK